MAAGDFLVYLPLVIVTLLAAPVAVAPVSSRAELLISRLALPVFGGYVAKSSPRRPDQIKREECTPEFRRAIRSELRRYRSSRRVRSSSSKCV